MPEPERKELIDLYFDQMLRHYWSGNYAAARSYSLKFSAELEKIEAESKQMKMKANGDRRVYRRVA